MDRQLHVEKDSNGTAMDQGLKSDSEGIDECFVWPPELRPDMPHDKFDMDIPVIDLTPVLQWEKLTKDLANMEEREGGSTMERTAALKEQIKACEAGKASVQNQIGAACEEYGFFQIVHHGVPSHLLKQLTECCQNIFDLPLEEKMKAEGGFQPHSPAKSGYGPMTLETAYSRVGKSHVWSEGFDVESPDIMDPGRVEKVTKSLWPNEPEKSRLGLPLLSSSEECGRRLSDVTVLLLRLMASSLGLPEEALESLVGPDFQTKQVYARLRVNHYPKCVEPEKTWGFHGHTDTSVITVLHQDAVGGLQVHFKDGSWHGIRPIDGALVVNVGNYLQVWTNRRFLSAEHRAVANNRSGRISVAYFVIRVGDSVFSPCPGLVDVEHPRRYRSFTREEYFDKLWAIGIGKDRDEFLDNAFGTQSAAVR